MNNPADGDQAHLVVGHDTFALALSGTDRDLRHHPVRPLVELLHVRSRR